jgi:hypothetical protein
MILTETERLVKLIFYSCLVRGGLKSSILGREGVVPAGEARM